MIETAWIGSTPPHMQNECEHVLLPSPEDMPLRKEGV